MPTELSIGIPVFEAFLLTLARVAGIFSFIPIPGIRSGFDSARVLFTLALSALLLPLRSGMPPWPDSGMGWMFAVLASEFAFGVTIGLAVAFLMESAQVAAQMISLQAGYSYASTIDPTTQADSGVLALFAQFVAGTIFFATGLDRQVVKLIASSFSSIPPGSFLVTPSIGAAVYRLGAGAFQLGIRLAMPEMALLLLLDISFALIGRLQPQMQFISLAFPIKMLAALMMLSLTLAVFPSLWQDAAGHTLEFLNAIAGRT